MPAKKHNFTWLEIQAGLLVLTALALTIGFAAVTLGLQTPEERVTYYAKFTNTIGLNPGADVRYGGFKVGRVTNIFPDPEDKSQIVVAASVLKTTPVNDESIATITAVSLTSPVHLEISTGDAKAELLAAGDTIDSVTLSGSFIELPDLEGVTHRTEKLLDDLRAFLGVEAAQEKLALGEGEFTPITDVMTSARGGLDKVNTLVGDVQGVLAENRPTINELLQQAQDVAAEAKRFGEQLNGVVGENRDTIREGLASTERLLKDLEGVVDQVSGEMEGMIASLEGALESAGGLTGDARAFLDASRPTIEDVLQDLRDALRNMRSFSQILSERPDALLRGQPPQGRIR